MNAELYRTDSLEIKREHIVQKRNIIIVQPFMLSIDVVTRTYIAPTSWSLLNKLFLFITYVRF
jgi:hypothetical protein